MDVDAEVELDQSRVGRIQDKGRECARGND